MEKEEIARIEKYAQAHLDRAQSLSAGASNTAVAWLIALLLIWTGSLETKLTQVRATRSALAAKNVSDVKAKDGEILDAGTVSLFQKAEAKFKAAAAVAAKQDVELPLSIKAKIYPEWLPTLWLALSFGLLNYLFRSRRQVLALTARGIKLLTCDVKSAPVFVRTLVSSCAWWLTPLPSKPGTYLSCDDFHAALRMNSRHQKIATIMVLVSSLVLVVIELRVFYIGFCVTACLLGTDLPQGTDLPEGHKGNSSLWLLFASLNTFLCCLYFFTIWKWFSPRRVEDDINEQHSAFDRRAFLEWSLQTLAIAIAGTTAISSSTIGFAAVWDRSKRTTRGRKNKRREHQGENISYPVLAEGLYENPATGTVHMVMSGCRRCIENVDTGNLKKISDKDVPWMTLEKRSDRPAQLNKLPVPSEAPREAQTHIHKRHYQCMIEQHAIALIMKGEVGEACRLLAGAVAVYAQREGIVAIRLCDLLAGLSVRTGDMPTMASLIETVTFIDKRNLAMATADQNRLETKVFRPGTLISYLYRLSDNRYPKRYVDTASNDPQPANSILTARINKWRDSNASWHKRWSNHSRSVRWGWSSRNPKHHSFVDIP